MKPSLGEQVASVALILLGATLVGVSAYGLLNAVLFLMLTLYGKF